MLDGIAVVTVIIDKTLSSGGCILVEERRGRPKDPRPETVLGKHNQLEFSKRTVAQTETHATFLCSLYVCQSFLVKALISQN